jgi:hypothetical protein
VTLQELPEIDEQFDQPLKVDPAAAVGVRVIGTPLSNCAAQAPLGQVMPAGVLVTDPLPVPANVTVSTAFEALPPGHTELVGSFTVTLAKPITMSLLDSVSLLLLAVTPVIPQAFPVVETTPPSTVIISGRSAFQVT